jgi:CRP/FNR family transcriptional regulator, cyclic AMP receptor protein
MAVTTIRSRVYLGRRSRRALAGADPEVMAALRSAELFATLSEGHLARIAQLGKELRFEPGTELIVQGDEAGRYFLILEGKAEVMMDTQSQAVLGPGDGAGETALVDGGPRTATVVARTPVRAFSLTSWHFQPLLAEPEIAGAVINQLCRRLRAAGPL